MALPAGDLPIVALVGRPNVGKSSLFNRLTEAPQAVVEAAPGTTRDRLYAEADWGGGRFLVVDTGGLAFDAHDTLQEQTAKQANVAIAEADAIIFVVDVVTGPTPLDIDVAALLRRTGKPIILAANKADSVGRSEGANEFYALGIGKPHPVSAYHGMGTGDLLDGVLAALPAVEPAAEEDDTRLRIAIVGRPNVGKSLLLNRILGEERTVVSTVPGTTRDSIDSIVRYGGAHAAGEGPAELVLVDTAGIRSRAKVVPGVEHYSVLRSLRAIRRADVALLLTDATEPFTSQDTHIGGIIADETKGAVLLVNKWDLVAKDPHVMRRFQPEAQRAFRFMPWMPTLFVSALTGQRVNRILDTVLAAARERERRIPTGQLNELIGRATAGACAPLRAWSAPENLLCYPGGDTAPPVCLLRQRLQPDALRLSAVPGELHPPRVCLPRHGYPPHGPPTRPITSLQPHQPFPEAARPSSADCYTRGMTPVGQSYLLFQLQQIDSQGDGALQRIQELDTRLADRVQRRRPTATHRSTGKPCTTSGASCAIWELQLGSVQEKLTIEERRLYAGRGAPRSQLQSLHQEVESLQSRVSELEDAVLVAMEAVEEAEAAATAAAQRAAAAQAAGEQHREALGREKAEVEAQLRQLQHDRSDITAQLAPVSTALYDRLRQQAGGIAVAEVAQGRCQGCRLTLPSHTIQQARQADRLQQCPTCRRVLYIAL